MRRHGERRKVACGKLCCCAVIFGLLRVILCFAQFNGKYNITETEGFNITFVLTKISLQRSWNITKKFLHLYCSSFLNELYERPIDDLNFMTDEYLHPYLLYIKDNKRVYSTVLSHSVSFGLNEVFQQLYDTIFNPVLERYYYPVADRKYAMMFYLNGITAIVSEWLKDGCEKSVDDVSKIICGCIFGHRGLNV